MELGADGKIRPSVWFEERQEKEEQEVDISHGPVRKMAQRATSKVVVSLRGNCRFESGQGYYGDETGYT